MKNDETEFVDAILRNDFVSFLYRCFLWLNPGATFLDNWHLRAIAYQLDRVRRGEITRLIINLPPRYLKSITVSVAFSAFLLGLDPERRIISISYGDDLSAKHASDFRSVVNSPWFRRVFWKMRIARNTELEVTTTRRGFRKATSVSGTLTGLGGDLIMIDDPQKPIDAQSEARRNSVNQWVSNTLMSRLDNKQTSAVIVVMQRVHMDDLSGFLLNSSDDWTVLSLPAIAEKDEYIPIGPNDLYHRKAGEALHPTHESIETLRKLEQTLGPDVFAAQYQQSPVPAGGAMIKREWFGYYDEAPERVPGSRIIQSYDTAAKDGAQNDYTVCTTWLVQDGNYYLLDLVRDRFEYPLLRDTAIELAKSFPAPRDSDRRCIHRHRFGPGSSRERLFLRQPHQDRARQDRPSLCSTGQVCRWSRVVSEERSLYAGAGEGVADLPAIASQRSGGQHQPGARVYYLRRG